MKKPNSPLDLNAYNQEVKTAYFKLLKHTMLLTAKLENSEHRVTLQHSSSSKVIGYGTKLHELITPIFYLALECEGSKKLCIHFGFEQLGVNEDYSAVTRPFLRILHNLTAKRFTVVNIEDCINVDYIMFRCKELYEAVSKSNHDYIIKQIPYRKMGREKSLQLTA